MMPRGWADWLGILGFAIAIFAVGLQWLQYRWSKRTFRVQSEPRVNLRAVYNPPLGDTRPTWVLQVYVVNTGLVPIYISHVTLSYHTATRAQQVIIPQKLPGPNPIEPGDQRYFALSGDEYDNLEDIGQLARSSINIEVATPEKTIKTLTGDQIPFGLTEYDGSVEACRVIELDPCQNKNA